MASPPHKSRTTSLHDEAYAELIALLIKRRLKSGLSQQAVADALGWNQSIVAKIESVQRRLDIIELIRMADVIGFDPSRFVKDIQPSVLRKPPT